MKIIIIIIIIIIISKQKNKKTQLKHLNYLKNLLL